MPSIFMMLTASILNRVPESPTTIGECRNQICGSRRSCDLTRPQVKSSLVSLKPFSCALRVSPELLLTFGSTISSYSPFQPTNTGCSVLTIITNFPCFAITVSNPHGPRKISAGHHRGRRAQTQFHVSSRWACFRSRRDADSRYSQIPANFAIEPDKDQTGIKPKA